MATTAQKAILKAKLSGVLTELMLKTIPEQVFIDDDTTLDEKLLEMINALNGKAPSNHTHSEEQINGLENALSSRPTTKEMNDAISNAVSSAISSLIDGAPDAYNTLKEVSDYITSHGDVVNALYELVGDRANKNTVTALQSTVTALQDTIDKLGALASKNKVSESDLDDTLKEKVNAASQGNHSHNNKSVLDSITSASLELWNGKAKIYASESQPSGLTENDLWLQLVD